MLRRAAGGDGQGGLWRRGWGGMLSVGSLLPAPLAAGAAAGVECVYVCEWRGPCQSWRWLPPYVLPSPCSCHSRLAPAAAAGGRGVGRGWGVCKHGGGITQLESAKRLHVLGLPIGRSVEPSMPPAQAFWLARVRKCCECNTRAASLIWCPGSAMCESKEIERMLHSNEQTSALIFYFFFSIPHFSLPFHTIRASPDTTSSSITIPSTFTSSPPTGPGSSCVAARATCAPAASPAPARTPA